MKKLFLIVFMVLRGLTCLKAQYVYTIKADSVKLTNCDSSELIIENHTQNVPGFLFNTGNGRTIFKRGSQKLGNGIYLIGADTVQTSPNAWVQGGNSFGTTGILGTLDNNNLDFYTNNTFKARLTPSGSLLIGGIGNTYGDMLYVNGTATFGNGVSLNVGNPYQSRVFSPLTLQLQSNATNAPQIYMHNETGPNFGGSTVVSMGTDISTLANPAADILEITGNGGTPVAYFRAVGRTLLGGAVDNGVHTLQVVGGIIATKDATINGITIGRGGCCGVNATHDLSNTAIGAATLVNNISGTGNTAVGYNSQAGLGSGGSNTSLGTFSLYGLVLGNNNVGIGSTAGFGSEGSGNVFIGPGSGQSITADNKLYIANSGASSLIYGDFSTRQVQIFAGVSPAFLASSNFIVNGDTYLSDSARLNTVRTGTSADSVLVIDAATHAIHKVAQSSLAFNGVLNSSLAVNGPITAQKLTLSARDWPDYVFDSAYRLPSADSLRQYIKQNNHLPEAPSAVEVDRKGVDVGDNQKLLLKKIEELTLYMLKQEERIQNLEQRLQQQNKVIDKLKTTR
jgi:hypothetical protein